MLALRLFLPESWTSKRARLERAGVPAEYRTARTKPEMALVEIDRAIVADVRFGCVLADAGYGLSAPFRQGLTARKLAWAVGIPRHLKVYPARCADDLAGCRSAVVPVSGTFLTFYRYRLKTCWPTPHGAPSVGAPARKESSRLVLLPSACGSQTDHRSGSGTKVSNICPGTRLGSSANTGCRGRRNTISPTCRRRPTAHPGGHHQGAMDLRAGSPTAERRTRSRSLRGTILARPSPSCAHDDDRLRLPPASPARNSKTGKKESTGRRLSQLCPPCVTPSSNSSLDHRRSDVRIAENGFATSSGVSKSAKVVRVPLHSDYDSLIRGSGAALG